MVAEAVRALRLLVHVRDLRRTDRDADRRDASAATDQQLRRDKARSRARARPLRARARPAVGGACDISMRQAPIRTARSAKIMRRRSTSSRARFTRRPADPALKVFGDDYPTPDGTCLRDYIHVSGSSRTPTCARSRCSLSAARPAPTISERASPHSVREVITTVERVSGLTVPWSIGPRRAGDPAVRMRSSGARPG